MTTTAATWERRVREWKASGKTAAKFGVERGISPGSLWNWAHRLGQTKRHKARAPALRLVRVDRVAAAEPVVVAVDGAARLCIEMGGARVEVLPGFDRATLAAIVDILRERRP